MIFGSNFKKKRGMVILVIVFFIIGAGLSVIKSEKTNLFHLMDRSKKNDHTKSQPYFYATNNTKTKFLLGPEINSDIIQQPVVRLFIPIFDNELEEFRNRCGLEKPKNALISDNLAIEKSRNLYLACYNQHHNVHIDDEPLQVDFMKYDHDITGQFGILCYIDLSSFDKGARTLKVTKESGHQKQWNIPFYLLKLD